MRPPLGYSNTYLDPHKWAQRPVSILLRIRSQENGQKQPSNSAGRLLHSFRDRGPPTRPAIRSPCPVDEVKDMRKRPQPLLRRGAQLQFGTAPPAELCSRPIYHGLHYARLRIAASEEKSFMWRRVRHFRGAKRATSIRPAPLVIQHAMVATRGRIFAAPAPFFARRSIL